MTNPESLSTRLRRGRSRGRSHDGSVVDQFRRAYCVVLGAHLVLMARLGRAPKLPRDEVRGRYPKVFVMGCPRSGTTWVKAILEHPAVIATKESHALPRVDDAVRRGRYSVIGWSRLLYRYDRGRRGHGVGLHCYVDRSELQRLAIRAIRSGSSNEDVADRLIDSVFDSYFDRSGGDDNKVFFEKTPGHLRYADRILRLYPEAKVVEVLRDGRDVCVSMQMLALRQTWPPRTREAQIREWVDFAERELRLRSDPELGHRVMLLRYEDLKDDPTKHIERLFEFAGLPVDDAFVRGVAQATDFSQHEKTGPGLKARKGAAGDWVNHFTAADVHLFEELAGSTFRRAGYHL